MQSRSRAVPLVPAAVAVALAVSSSPAVAEVFNVPGDFGTIQAALDAAADGDEILVAPGTYTGTGAQVADMLGKAVTLRSTGGPDVTVLDGEQARRVIVCTTGEGRDTVIEGFTITLGFAPGFAAGGGMLLVGASPTVTDCIFHGNGIFFDTAGGGGMHNDGASPEVTGCTFRFNRAFGSGGGINNTNGSHAIVTGCLFRANSAGSGAGLFADSTSSAEVTDCDFLQNLADDGKGFSGIGGGVAAFGPTTAIAGCTFDGNWATDSGGGANLADALITDSVFIGNTGSEHGGGLVTQGDVEVEDTILTGNTGGTGGGAETILPGAVFTRCTISGNETIFGQGGGLQTFANTAPTLIDTLVCGNTPLAIDGPWQDGGGNTVTDGPCPPCIADLDGDEAVGIGDLLVMLAAWGCTTCPEIDLDGDGTVAIGDLLILLAAWGLCP